MQVYLSIITTILVISQIIRVTQNTIQLNHERKIYKAQLDKLADISYEDIVLQRETYKLLMYWLLKNTDDKGVYDV